MKRSFGLSLFVLLWAGTSFAQTAVVKRDVNLRSEPATSSHRLETLIANTALKLLESEPTAGFYHVSAPDGQDGWVWGRNVEVLPGTTPAPIPSPSPTPTSAVSAPGLLASLTNARKAAVGEPLIENGTEVCGPTGDAKNSTAIALNTNKNRTDVPGDSDYVDISWRDLASLPTDRVDDFVGAPVRVVGFLSHKINVENTGRGESTNCHLTGDNEVDWHIYLTNSSGQPISRAVIVETTPRTRPKHLWTPEMLTTLVDTATSARISGWLMYDSEHINVIGSQRATVWEVHPITKIEIQKGGGWIDLDTQP